MGQRWASNQVVVVPRRLLGPTSSAPPLVPLQDHRNPAISFSYSRQQWRTIVIINQSPRSLRRSFQSAAWQRRTSEGRSRVLRLIFVSGTSSRSNDLKMLSIQHFLRLSLITLACSFGRQCAVEQLPKIVSQLLIGNAVWYWFVFSSSIALL